MSCAFIGAPDPVLGPVVPGPVPPGDPAPEPPVTSSVVGGFTTHPTPSAKPVETKHAVQSFQLAMSDLLPTTGGNEDHRETERGEPAEVARIARAGRRARATVRVVRVRGERPAAGGGMI